MQPIRGDVEGGDGRGGYGDQRLELEVEIIERRVAEHEHDAQRPGAAGQRVSLFLREHVVIVLEVQ